MIGKRRLAAMSEEDLFKENQRVMEARSKAEAGFQEESAEINAELDRRHARKVVADALANVAPELRAGALAEMGGEAAEEEETDRG